MNKGKHAEDIEWRVNVKIRKRGEAFSDPSKYKWK